MFRTTIVLLSAIVALSIGSDSLLAQDKAKPNAAPIVATDAVHAGLDFKVQGEYAGEANFAGKKLKAGVRVIALGDRKFRAAAYEGGLPGDGWDGKNYPAMDGVTKDGATCFVTGDGNGKLIIKDGQLAMTGKEGVTMIKLKKVLRTSPTLGAKPPAGAIVLFDGKSADAFVDGHVKNGLLVEGSTSKQKFQSYKIHLEFMLPFMPDARGQGRGNSGYYSQGRYETQILDSFGLVPQQDDCGAIYGIKPPRINMCYPPLSWQTYDVDFTAAEYKDGKKVKHALITVLHNGVEVQKDTEATHATTAAPVQEGPEPGPIYLQNHGNPMRFRNIWVVEKK